MENYTRKDRAFYSIDRNRTCVQLGITTNQYNAFRRLANQLHQIDEWTCNGRKYNYDTGPEYTEEEYDRDERLLMETIGYKAGLVGLHYFHQSDPRGVSLYLSTEPLNENSYTNGSAIY